MTNLIRARQEKTRRLVQVNRVDSDFYPFAGGLNLIDSPLSSTPGQCQNALNYEIGFAGGYRRIAGYELFDGTASTAQPDYYLLPYRSTVKPTMFRGQSQNGLPNHLIDRRQNIYGLSSGAVAELVAESCLKGAPSCGFML